MASCSCVRQITSPSTTRATLGGCIGLVREQGRGSVAFVRSQWLRLPVPTPGLKASNVPIILSGRRKTRRGSTAVSAAVVTTPETEAEPDAAIPTNVEVLVATQDGGEATLAPPAKAKKKTKGLKNIMETLNKNAVELLSKDKVIPDIRTGDIVQLRVEVSENRKRASVLRGIVISKHNAGSGSTFRIRRIISGIGVEMVFPLYSPIIKEIKVLDSRKVRRAKLFYLREKIASLSSC